MGDAPETWADRIGDESSAVQQMVRWFFERYEDPAENTPFESAEGGYQYIHGGPVTADDVLDDEFATRFEPMEIQQAADFISEWGDEWVPVPSDESEEDEPEEDEDEAVEDEEDDE